MNNSWNFPLEIPLRREKASPKSRKIPRAGEWELGLCVVDRGCDFDAPALQAGLFLFVKIYGTIMNMIIKRICLWVVVTSIILFAVIALLAIWDVIKDNSFVWKSLTSLAVVCFSGLVGVVLSDRIKPIQ